MNDTVLTISGNLTADPELRISTVSREFVISEGLSAGNRRVGARW